LPALSGTVRSVTERPVTRRRFLAGATLATTTLSACTGKGERTVRRPSPSPLPSPSPSAPSVTAAPTDADTMLVAAIVRDKQRLVAAYQATLSGHRSLRRDIRVLLVHHRDHLDALGAAAAKPARPDRGGSLREAVAGLRRLEIDATRSLRGRALAARSGDLARVIAAMAASSAQHADLLGALAATSRRRP